MSDEMRQAYELADRILERPYADPDDDLAVLSRQFLRLLENSARLIRNPDAPDRLAYLKRLCTVIDPEGSAEGRYG